MGLNERKKTSMKISEIFLGEQNFSCVCAWFVLLSQLLLSSDKFKKMIAAILSRA